MSSLNLYPYFLYCTNVQNNGFGYHKFRTLEAVRTFLDMCILTRDTRWDVRKVYPKDPNPEPLLVVIDHDNADLFTFRGAGLEDAMELTRYQPVEFHAQDAPMLRGFAAQYSSTGGSEVNNPSTGDDTPATTPDKPKREPRPIKPAKPTGLISASDIASAMKLDAKQVRDALRKSGTPKPAHGWNFNPTEALAISKAIADNLKAGTPFTAYKAK